MHRLAILAALIGSAQQPSFQTQTDIVNILVTVRDQHNRIVTTLSKSNFRVFEDGRPRDVQYFARDSSAPLTLGVVIDSSPVQSFLLQAERDAVMNFFSTAVREKDLAFLINFASDVTLLTDLTNDHTSLQRGLRQMRSSGPYAPGPLAELNLGRAHLSDAIYLASEKLAVEGGHKAILLIASGDDKGSKVKLDEALTLTRKADAAVYAIRYSDGEGSTYASLSQQTVMRKIADATGGRSLTPAGPDSLIGAVREVAEELRGQYSIGFTPAKLDGKFHKIEVRLDERGLRAESRKTYFAEPH